MSFKISAPVATRLRGELPPTAPIPAALQTVACRCWPTAYLEWCRARYGSRFTVYPVDMPPLVFLSDPDEIRDMIAAPSTVLHPGAGATVSAPLIGESSFMLCEEDKHMYGRNAIMPAFHRKVVKNHAAMAAEMVEREIASWPVDAAFALHPRLRALTLKVILRTVFADADPLLDNLHERLLALLSVTASFVLQEPRLRHLPGWRATWRRFVKRRAELDRLLFALLDRRRAGNRQHGDLLDRLLAAHNPDGSPMTDRQVRDNLMSMIVAGHETTAAELAWAFQLLAHNQPAQDRLLEEIDGGVEEEYLTATVNETLRHRPAFLFLIPRAIVRPIEIGGWSYRAPARLLGCTYLVHHDPESYPDPHAFRPERFLGETLQPRTWLPWGAGPKSCLGRHLALLEMRLVLRGVLSTRLVLPAGGRIERERWRSAILVPHAGSRVVLRRRTPLKMAGVLRPAQAVA
ncbi:MAG TPA: cytochrome P450 [Solirubrobacteraceae bacterium]|jgi:cytochrome P450|nr:cytochrome P450 [Solirubrobacteraceae bacterium]